MAYGCEQALLENDPIKRLALEWLGTTHLGDRSRNHYLMRALRKITLPENAAVLNAGCANGAHSFYLAERYPGWEITGVEIESEKIGRAKTIADRKGTQNLSFQVGDIQGLPFTESFHLIFSMHVLTFLKDDVQALKRFSRALKRGGYLILSVPTPPGPPLRQRLFPFLSRSEKNNPSPQESSVRCNVERFGYTKEELEGKLEQAGLRSLHISYPAGPIWQSACVFEKSIKKRKFLRRLVHPFLIFLVDLDQWLPIEYRYPIGQDCLVIAQRPT